MSAKDRRCMTRAPAPRARRRDAGGAAVGARDAILLAAPGGRARRWRPRSPSAAAAPRVTLRRSADGYVARRGDRRARASRGPAAAAAADAAAARARGLQGTPDARPERRDAGAHRADRPPRRRRGFARSGTRERPGTTLVTGVRRRGAPRASRDAARRTFDEVSPAPAAPPSRSAPAGGRLLRRLGAGPTAACALDDDGAARPRRRASAPASSARLGALACPVAETARLTRLPRRASPPVSAGRASTACARDRRRRSSALRRPRRARGRRRAACAAGSRWSAGAAPARIPTASRGCSAAHCACSVTSSRTRPPPALCTLRAPSTLVLPSTARARAAA